MTSLPCIHTNSKIKLLETLLSSYNPFSNNNSSVNNLIPLNFLLSDVNHNLLVKALELIDEKYIKGYFIIQQPSLYVNIAQLRSLYLQQDQKKEEEEEDKIVPGNQRIFLEYVVDEGYQKLRDTKHVANNGEEEELDKIRDLSIVNVDLKSWFCSCLKFNDIYLKNCQVNTRNCHTTGNLKIFERKRGLPQFSLNDNPFPPLCHHLLAVYLVNSWTFPENKLPDIDDFFLKITMEDWLNDFVTLF